MNVLGCIAAGLPHHDVIPCIVPFQNRPGTNSQLLTDIGGNRDLTLSGELGVRESHSEDYHGNGRRAPAARHQLYRSEQTLNGSRRRGSSPADRRGGTSQCASPLRTRRPAIWDTVPSV